MPFLGVEIFGWLPVLAGGRYKPRFAAERKIQVRKDDEKIYSDKDLKEVYAPKASS